MEFEYILPDFKKYFPYKLSLEKEVVFSTWKNFEKYRKDTDIEKIILVVKNNNPISGEEFEILIYNLDNVKKIVEKKYELKLYEILKKIKIKDINDKNRPKNLIEDIYINLTVYFKDLLIENTLKEIAVKFVFEKNYNNKINKIFEEYVNSNLIFIDYIFSKLEKAIISEKNYKEFIKRYNIQDKMDIFKVCIRRLLIDNIEKYVQMSKHEIDNILIELLELYFEEIDTKKECYKKILLYYHKNNIDFEKYSEIWMLEILKKLGEPNKSNNKWSDFDTNLIEIMKKWLLKRELEKIFTINVRDSRRLEFWKQYIKFIEKVEFFKDLNQAIVMETKEHTFVEFGAVGNAFYCYHINDCNVNLISIYEEKYNYSTNRAVKEMKNQEKAIIRETHSGQWEMNFEYELRKLGYKLGANKNGYNW